jgi:hypothetical protein
MQLRREDLNCKRILISLKDTKLVVGTKGMSCEQRLKLPDISTLERRRVRGDLIEIFKIMKGLDDG